MIIGLLICTIGIIPIVLALNINRNYKGSDLYLGLLIYMIILTIWQFDIGVLYFKGLLNKDVIFFLFRLFRIAPTFVVPVVFYIAYAIFKINLTTFQNETILNRIFKKFLTKKVFYGLLVWSTMIFAINCTYLGIKNLKVVNIDHLTIKLYFPEYGPLGWLYIVHTGSVVIFLFFILIISRKIVNSNIKSFLTIFSICSLLLFVSGFINFSPGTGALASSIGVIFFSSIILFAFINLNTKLALKYNELMERQSKLDFTGNLVGSLIHELNNTNQIIQGFSKLLQQNGMHKEKDGQSLNMIITASEHLNDLSKTYMDYIKYSNMKLKIEDLNQLIELSIELSKQILIDNQVEIDFVKKYSPINAFVNKTYIQQVFINLIKNSIEAMPSPLEKRQIIINTDIRDENICIDFYDTGSGIPQHCWESVFDPFISTKSQGMGLGLPFVKKIIFEHRGDIKIIDSTSAGTHFQIKLPQYAVSNIDA